jgi:hypothetical protein
MVYVLNERELAAWLREQGRLIRFANGRHWHDNRGFYRLLHFDARMRRG